MTALDAFVREHGELLLDALDSHLYWQVNEDTTRRNDGHVLEPLTDDERRVERVIDDLRALLAVVDPCHACGVAYAEHPTGDTFTPAGEWVWTCPGDFGPDTPAGRRQRLLDLTDESMADEIGRMTDAEVTDLLTEHEQENDR